MSAARRKVPDMRQVLRQLLVLTGVVSALGVLSKSVPAQDSSRRMPDSVQSRLLECGTHGPVLERQQDTREVKQALGKVASCPEGPQVIARLWDVVSGADSAYVRTLATVSSIAHTPVADAMRRAVSDRNRSTIVRLRALGALVRQLDGRYSGLIAFDTVREAKFDPSGQRIVGWDTVRVAIVHRGFGSASPPVRIDEALRARILTAIDRIASDSSDVEEMRLAAREISLDLSRRSR
jgi:hypothetical protein